MRGIFIKKKKFPLLFAISALTSSAPLRPVFPILLGREVELVDVRRLEMEGVVDMMLVEEVDMMLGEVGDNMLTGRFKCSTEEAAGKLN